MHSVAIRNLTSNPTNILEQYKQGLISVGKMAQLMDISKSKAIKLLNDLNIDWIDYTKEEIDVQVKVLDRLQSFYKR